MNKEIILKIIDNKINELDNKAFKHCFKKGKMCKECWERKVPLMEVKKELNGLVEDDGAEEGQ